jgi:hypothetical protein
MSNVEHYMAKLAEAQAIAPNETKSPYMPIGIYLQEAEDLRHWAFKDQAALVAAGLRENILNDLDVTAGAAREAQSKWMEDLKIRKDAEQRWKDESPAAFDLRDELTHTFNYAYRHSDDLLAQLEMINEGGGSADMIQDLNDLAVMGRSNPEPLQAIGFDMTQLDKAAMLSSDMADLRAMANGDKQEGNEALIIRNQMYTLLKRLVDEIRACGKYLFWRDEKRIAGYVSSYNQKVYSKQKAKGNPDVISI